VNVDGFVGKGGGALVSFDILCDSTVYSGILISAKSGGLSLRRKYRPTAAVKPTKINRPATIPIIRGALLFDSGADVAFNDGATEGEGDITFAGEAAGSGCAAMISESGFQPLNPSW
tara:strand:- start:702 stop:1052 length:351 start_codon:yes stop_codon:yes gene_type:complete